MGTPQCRPGDQSPIKPRRPVRRARREAKHSTSHTNAVTVTQNQPARRSPKHDTEPLCTGVEVLSSEERPIARRVAPEMSSPMSSEPMGLFGAASLARAGFRRHVGIVSTGCR